MTRVPVEPGFAGSPCLASVSRVSSRLVTLQGDSVRNLLRVLWCLWSVKLLFMLSMVFLPSDAIRLRM